MPEMLIELHPLLRLLLMCVLGPAIALLSLLAACLMANLILRFLERCYHRRNGVTVDDIVETETEITLHRNWPGGPVADADELRRKFTCQHGDVA